MPLYLPPAPPNPGGRICDSKSTMPIGFVGIIAYRNRFVKRKFEIF